MCAISVQQYHIFAHTNIIRKQRQKQRVMQINTYIPACFHIANHTQKEISGKRPRGILSSNNTRKNVNLD